jgi:hypothetical protein
MKTNHRGSERRRMMNIIRAMTAALVVLASVLSAASVCAKGTTEPDTVRSCSSEVHRLLDSKSLSTRDDKLLRRKAARLRGGCSGQVDCRFNCRVKKGECTGRVAASWDCAKACKSASADRRKCATACKKAHGSFKSQCRATARSCRKQCAKARESGSCKGGLKAASKALGKLKSGKKSMVKSAIKACGDQGSGRARKPKARKKNKDRGACQRKCNKIRSKKHKVRCVLKC